MEYLLSPGSPEKLKFSSGGHWKLDSSACFVAELAMKPSRLALSTPRKRQESMG